MEEDHEQRSTSVKTIYRAEYVALIAMFRTRRRELGLTQLDIARELGVGRTVIAKTEIRERRLDVLETLRLCQVLKLSFRKVEDILRASRR